MSSKVSKLLLETGVVRDVGLEYLTFFRMSHRSRAMESLGKYPTVADVRQYVRDVDDEVLCSEGCRNNVLVIVDDYVVVTARPTECHPDDVWQFWVELFFLPYEHLEADEYELLACSFGDVSRRELMGHAGQFPPVLQQYVETKFHLQESMVSFPSDGTVDAQVVACDMILDQFGTTRVEFEHEIIVSRRSLLGSDEIELEDGFCYEKVFPVVFRPLVRHWLGKEPDVSSVVDAMILFRRYDLLNHEEFQHRLVVVSPDKFHIDFGGSNPYAILYDLTSAYMQGNRGLVGTELLEYDDFDFKKKKKKDMCVGCGYIVTLDGHVERCRSSSRDDHSYKILLRRRAWLGDDRQRMDVRQIIMCTDLPPERYEVEAQKYTEGGTQALWYSSYEGEKMSPLGNSVSALSTAFEASYVGKFREDYVAYLLRQYDKLTFPVELVDMIVDDKSKLTVALHVGARMLEAVS